MSSTNYNSRPGGYNRRQPRMPPKSSGLPLGSFRVAKDGSNTSGFVREKNERTMHGGIEKMGDLLEGFGEEGEEGDDEYDDEEEEEDDDDYENGMVKNDAVTGRRSGTSGDQRRVEEDDDVEGKTDGDDGSVDSLAVADATNDATSSDSDDDDSNEESWSVRVTLISAVDLPPSIIPKAPLCPLLKFGLITSKPPKTSLGAHLASSSHLDDSDDDFKDDRTAGASTAASTLRDEELTISSTVTPRLEKPPSASKQQRLSILSQMESDGLTNIPRARIRCSSGKILSARDNGAAEWHEEMRWDGVKRPLQTVLAVELCARAVLPPPSSAPDDGSVQTESTAAETMTTNSSSADRGSSGGGGMFGMLAEERAESFFIKNDPNLMSQQQQRNRELLSVPERRAQQRAASDGVGRGDMDYNNLYQQAVQNRDIEMEAFGKNTGGEGMPSPSALQRSTSEPASDDGRGGGRQGQGAQGGMGFNLNNLLQPGKDDPEQQGGLGGLRSMWRKHRQQLEKGRQKRMHESGKSLGSASGSQQQTEMEAASAAAAVARFIMEKGDGSESGQQMQSIDSSTGSGGGGGRVQREIRPGWTEGYGDDESESDSDDTDSERASWKNERKRNDREEDGDADTDEAMRSPSPPQEQQQQQPAKKKRKITMVEDLRLGSLVIPLSRLPLENATCGNGSARIEQWYQLDSTSSAMSPTAAAASTPSSAGKRGGSGGIMSPRRNPSVLLEISFSSPQVLDESEDEMEELDDAGHGDVLWEDDEDKGGTREEAKRQLTEEEKAVEDSLLSGFKEGSGGGGDEGSAIGTTTTSPSERGGKSSLKRAALEQREQTKAAAAQTAAQTAEQVAKFKKAALAVMTASKLAPVEEKDKSADPVLEPGVVDYVAVVGARDIGNQRNDDGAKGWVNSTPDCCILEQFPKSDEFHAAHERFVALPNKVEWFCFPEGCRLWRGSEPPTHMDLNLKRFSASSPPNVASSIAAFDACLNCTTSFSWFVISSHSEEYGAKNIKTYCAVIRFYAPAPTGIDPTQDDYAQTIMGGMMGGKDVKKEGGGVANAKRLWVPLGICLTSSLPIVGILEAMLLRLCETLASRANLSLNSSSSRWVSNVVQNDIANLIVNFQSPITGLLHCSIPFLSGERLHVTMPPPTGLPPLPHGASVTSVCRLLGAEGLTVLLAAVLTECKILLHSSDIANLPMVAEVITSLIYPFSWALPYIPVLPDAMLEFVEAPLSYLLGIPTCNLKLIDPQVLSEMVVIDLDNGFTSPDYFDGRRGVRGTRLPTPLPASVASNISKAVFRLLREEEEVEEEYGSTNFSGSRHLPRLEAESLAERDFRIAVALQICGLVRGYQECLFFVSASQPVFNRDRFLRNAPALFEDRRGSLPALAGSPGLNPAGPGGRQGSGGSAPQRILSPRSKRFLSLLVNTQHFHQLLERLDSEETSFFHEVMDMLDAVEDQVAEEQQQQQTSSGAVASANHGADRHLMSGYGSSKLEEAATQLRDGLQKVEDKIPTYRVDRTEKRRRSSWVEDDDEMNVFDEMMEAHEEEHDLGFHDEGGLMACFTSSLLQPIVVSGTDPTLTSRRGSLESTGSGQSDGVHSLSVQYLVELEKSPWRYCKLFDIKSSDEDNEEEGAGQQQHPPINEQTESSFHVTTNHNSDSGLGNSPFNSSGSNSFQDPAPPVVAKLRSKVKLKDAIGERRYRAWKLAEEKKQFSAEESTRGFSKSDLDSSDSTNALDLTSLLSCAEDMSLDSSLGSKQTNARAAAMNVSPEQQRVIDARDRDVLRRCLERAYEGAQHRPSRFSRRSSNQRESKNADAFQENGRDLITEAEAALRNPSAQRFLVSVLSQRTRLENQRKRRQGQDNDGRHHQRSNQGSVSRLQPAAFECLVRLCCAMLEACMEEQDYEAAYRLLTHTAGFCTVMDSKSKEVGGGSSSNPAETKEEDGGDHNTKLVYMTGRIGMHPIFADLRLWERVLLLHQQDRNDKSTSGPGASASNSGVSTPTEGGQGGAGGKENADIVEYEAAVSTLYEMLGYGVPAEELARFATRVSEERGWFATERGQALLVLARRLSVRRDEGDMDGGAGGAGDLDLMPQSGGPHGAGPLGHGEGEKGADGKGTAAVGGGVVEHEAAKMEWQEIGWSHPSQFVPPTSTRMQSHTQDEADMTSAAAAAAAAEASKGGRNNRQGGYSLLNMLGGSGPNTPYDSPRNSFDHQSSTAPRSKPHIQPSSRPSLQPQSVDDDDIITPAGYAGRTAVTSLASFGGSVVATGGLDGSVFLAHTIRFGPESAEGDEDDQMSAGLQQRRQQDRTVRGVRLEWGSPATSAHTRSASNSGGSMSNNAAGVADGDFGVGAVSCLAAARGAGYRHGPGPGGGGGVPGGPSGGGGGGLSDEEELLAAMEGCRIVAGTTGGDLRVWSVKDVYAATVLAAGRDGGGDMGSAADAVAASMADMRLQHGSTADGASSSYARSAGMAHAARAMQAGGLHDVTVSGGSASSRLKYSLRGRALSGHRGGVTCVDVPSHIYRPDALVSGGADGLIKLWSLRQPTGRRGSKSSATVGGVSARHSLSSTPSSSRLFGNRQSAGGAGAMEMSSARGGKSMLGTEPQTTLTGHGGRVLCVKTAWHGDRLLSGGADRTVRIWDLAGSSGKCLHILSGHLGWVTHAHYWGPHTIVSASTDRSIALWDARVRSSPLFILRYHRSPVSDLLLGSRSEPLMVSAGGDGTIATWDFRTLAGSGKGGADKESNTAATASAPGGKTGGSASTRRCKTVREPVATMTHCQEGKGKFICSGSILLSRGAGLQDQRSVLSASIDGNLKEWDIGTGQMIGSQPTGHSDVVSCLSTYAESDNLRRGTSGGSNKQGGDSSVGGTITCSWDGTVRMRRLMLKNHNTTDSS